MRGRKNCFKGDRTHKRKRQPEIYVVMSIKRRGKKKRSQKKQPCEGQGKREKGKKGKNL